MNRLCAYLAGGLLPLIWACAAAGVERFDDISVAPQSVASGETYHGYREFRVALENHSLKQTHEVTLVFPDRPFRYGNSISRLARTVSLAPASRSVVPLWQPPVPISGNGGMQVLIDQKEAGTVGLPDPPRHLNRLGPRYGSPQPAAILVSRSLNFDDIGRMMQSERSSFSAAMATGAPDSRGRRRGGMAYGVWMPDPAKPGPHWIELDYNPPITAGRVRIYTSVGVPPGGAIELTGVSGTNLARIGFPPGPTGPTGARRTVPATQEFSFPPTAEPVKTVRLNFGPASAGSIGIDAVELVGPAGGPTAYASAARASSESSMSLLAGASMPGGESRELLRAEFPPGEWSESWLSYTPYDAIVLSAADIATAPPAVASALWQYTECGGNLVLLGGGEAPEPWRSRSAATLEGGRRFGVGLGQCFVFDKSAAADLNAAAVKTVTSAINETARSWQSLPDEAAANSEFPVVEDFKIPVRSTVFIMLAFVILIGPVNLVVLSRSNRRTWLLWTIPAISLATCVLVFVYSLLREGITPDARIEGLTVLDQVNRRASSSGLTAFYCPLTPSQGLFFSSDTEATPLIEMSGYRSGTQRELDWTQSQHLERGWVTARVPAHFQVRKSEIRRERLQLDYAAGQRTVVNGLASPIRSLWLADHSGRIYTGANIPPGQRVTLSPSADSPEVSSRLGVRAFLAAAGPLALTEISSTNAAGYLLPDTYIAELETNPFLENGLGPRAKSARTKSRCAVYGILDTP